MIDKTGQPRSDDEIKEALAAVYEIMQKQPLVLPLFTVNATTIKDALIELLQRRNADKVG